MCVINLLFRELLIKVFFFFFFLWGAFEILDCEMRSIYLIQLKENFYCTNEWFSDYCVFRKHFSFFKSEWKNVLRIEPV